MKHWYFAIGIALLWLVIFAIMIAPNERQVSVPDEYPRVILKTQPVDPRDLLRGDFVILSYEFNRLGQRSWEEPDDSDFAESVAELGDALMQAPAGTQVYIALDVDAQNRATAQAISLEKPTKGLFLAGKLRGAPNSWETREARFGIEKYFVPEGKGRELERARNSNNLEAEVAIDPESGKALVVDLLVNEEAVDFSEIEAEELRW